MYFFTIKAQEHAANNPSSDSPGQMMGGGYDA